MGTIVRERCNACEPGYAAYCRQCMDKVLDQRDEAERKGGECARDRSVLAEQLVGARAECERLRTVMSLAALSARPMLSLDILDNGERMYAIPEFAVKSLHEVEHPE